VIKVPPRYLAGVGVGEVFGDVGVEGEASRGDEAQLVDRVSVVYIICLFELDSMVVVGA